MEKYLLSYILFFMLIFNLSFISSNFVCGTVISSETISSSWVNVMVYFEENESYFTECIVNPENKFCCDLENISSVDFKVGKKVFAEVYDKKRGLIGGPVSLYLTDSGYDIFPEIKLKRVIDTNLPDNNLLVNKSSIDLNFSSEKNYKNIIYILNSSEGSFQQELCFNCNSSEFLIPLFKGKNEITIVGDNELFKKIVIYNLDYFNFNISFNCDKCKNKKNFLYVPAGEEMSVHFSFNSSHPVSGDFFVYFPNQWILLDTSNSRDFSLTHQGFLNNINDKKEFSVDYLVQTPKIFIKQDYTIYQKLNEYNLSTKVRIFKFKFIPFYIKNNFEKNYPEEILINAASPETPILLKSKEDSLKIVAIFPKKDIIGSYSDLVLKTNKNKGDQDYSFKILTTLSKEEIEKIFLVFKVQKGNSINLDLNGEEISLQIYQEENNYLYYSAYVQDKGPFRVKIF